MVWFVATDRRGMIRDSSLADLSAATRYGHPGCGGPSRGRGWDAWVPGWLISVAEWSATAGLEIEHTGCHGPSRDRDYVVRLPGRLISVAEWSATARLRNDLRRPD
jgi:hypothetical protein